MEKQYKLTDRVSKDSLKSPTFKKWLKRVLCFVCIFSLALQLTLCCIPMQASAAEDDSIVGTWVFNDVLTKWTDATGSESSYVDLSFESNSQSYSRINFSADLDYSPVFNVMQYGSTQSYRWSAYNNYNVWTNNNYKTIVIFSDPSFVYIESSSLSNSEKISLFKSWLRDNATKVVEEVYDFTGEYRLFNEQLTNLSFAQSGTVTQTYQFDYQIWNGYSADNFTVQASGSQVDISYAFTDEGSGGVTTVYRQLLRNGQKVGTWLVPRARLIYFESNPEDPTFQQWLLDNTVLVDESMLQTVYDFGYNNGFNDGWTDNLIGDTLNAPIQALNNITLLQVGNTVITLGGVIFTMIVLCILIVFLKKFAGG